MEPAKVVELLACVLSKIVHPSLVKSALSSAVADLGISGADEALNAIAEPVAPALQNGKKSADGAKTPGTNGKKAKRVGGVSSYQIFGEIFGQFA